MGKHGNLPSIDNVIEGAYDSYFYSILQRHNRPTPTYTMKCKQLSLDKKQISREVCFFNNIQKKQKRTHSILYNTVKLSHKIKIMNSNDKQDGKI